jgi:hypothetical protein
MLNTVTASAPFKIFAVENSQLFEIPKINRLEPTEVSGFEGDFFVSVFS